MQILLFLIVGLSGEDGEKVVHVFIVNTAKRLSAETELLQFTLTLYFHV